LPAPKIPTFPFAWKYRKLKANCSTAVGSYARLGPRLGVSSEAPVDDLTCLGSIAKSIKTAKTAVVARIATDELPSLGLAWLSRCMTAQRAIVPLRRIGRRTEVLLAPRDSDRVGLQAPTHVAGHAATAVALGRQTPSGTCPRPERDSGLPDLEPFRRELAVLVAGPVADLVARGGRVSPAGARDLGAAVQHAFDMLVRGSYWPDEPPPGARSKPLTGVLAMTIINRTFVETERAVALATRILIAGPTGSTGTDRDD
jgi:hypothetical protein